MVDEGVLQGRVNFKKMLAEGRILKSALKRTKLNDISMTVVSLVAE